MTPDANAPDMKMDASQLYREEVYTDQRIGTVRCLTPVAADGQRDASRAIQFVGSAQLLTPAGAIPLTFEIDAQTLSEAVEKFGEGARRAFEDTMEELKEMRRQASSSIVVPSMNPKGGIPGGGIQMP